MNMETNNPLDSVVMVSPPNDNTDGQDCPCGHAGSAHQPVDRRPEAGESGWKCLYCACTRANPAQVPSPR
jgi:hypothetical protein